MLLRVHVEVLVAADAGTLGVRDVLQHERRGFAL
jgi:hypothetical protein